MAEGTPLAPASPAPTSAPARRKSPARRSREAIAAFEEGASGRLDRIAVDAVAGRTRRGLRAAAPVIAAMLLDKAARGKGSPVDVAAATFLLNASGVTQNGAPISEKERARLDAELDMLDNLPAQEHLRLLCREANCAPLPEGP